MSEVLADSFQPYGFLLRPRRSSTPPESTSNDASLSGYLTPTHPASPALTSRAATPRQDSVVFASEHGKFLHEKLDFIVPPPLTPIERETPANARCLFMGHLRFETTTAEVRWIIQRLTGVTALKAEVRGAGCFVVYLASEADETKVRHLNRRLLFDHNGIWYAKTDDALGILLDYVEQVLPRGPSRRRALRLPRDSIVVEDTRRPNGSPNHRPAVPPTQPGRCWSTPTYAASITGQLSPIASEPGTPQASGFHGTSPPDYVFGDFNLPAPPPYGASLSQRSW